jgi:hypothetical protein
MAHGLADECQPVEDANGREDMGRVGALAAPRLEETTLAYPAQPRLEPPLFRLPRDQSGPELAQNGVIEAGSSQLQAQGVVPITAAAHRVSCLAV